MGRRGSHAYKSNYYSLKKFEVFNIALDGLKFSKNRIVTSIQEREGGKEERKVNSFSPLFF